MSDFVLTLYSGIWDSIDWLFPPRCVNCGSPGYAICPKCIDLIELINPPICDICGIPRKMSGNCATCKKERKAYEILRSVANYKGPIKKAIQANKYRRDITIGNELSRILSEYLNTLSLPIDIIAPIPLGKRRLAERGYNQVNTFAFPVAIKLQIKYVPKAIIRIRETKKQVGLSATERKINVQNAFKANEKLVQGKNILLLDDVATTGSTLSSGAEALIKGGADRVFAVSIARALFSSAQ